MNVNDLKENVGGTIRRFDDETNICGQQRRLPMTTGIMAYNLTLTNANVKLMAGPCGVLLNS